MRMDAHTTQRTYHVVTNAKILISEIVTGWRFDPHFSFRRPCSESSRLTSAEASFLFSTSASMDLAARIATAYDAACVRAATPGAAKSDISTAGGFIVDVSDETAGGFVRETSCLSNSNASQILPVSALPYALDTLKLGGAKRRDVQELLEAHSEYDGKHTEPVVPRAYFLEAVEAVMDGIRRSKRRRLVRRQNGEEASSNSEEGTASQDEYAPSDKDSASSSNEDDTGDGGEDNRASSSMSSAKVSKQDKNTNISKAKKEQGRLLYRLLLERIPLVAPTMLANYPSIGIREDVTDEEIESRQIGIDELRYATRSLGESRSTSELADMLYEAQALASNSTQTRSRAPAEAPRIGLNEYVSSKAGSFRAIA